MCGANKELKDYILDGSGYRQIGDDYRIKSRLYTPEIAGSNAKGSRSKVRIDEKQVMSYSPEYGRKAKADGEPVLLIITMEGKDIKEIITANSSVPGP
jgi:hypothetical protein